MRKLIAGQRSRYGAASAMRLSPTNRITPLARLALVWAVALGACGPDALTIPDPATPETPGPVAGAASALAAPVRAYTAALDRRAEVLITSHVEHAGLVRVRWWRSGRVSWEQTFEIPAGATVRAFPDCFFGGIYLVEMVAQGWSGTRDYGATVPTCYDPAPTP